MATRGRGGYRPNAGRRKGSMDRATLEAELAAAQQQLVEMAKKRQSGRKIAVDVLDDIMHLAMGLAAKHQPLSNAEIAGPGREPDEPKFLQYLELTGEFAGKLANFQSPKFKSTAISVETLGGMPADGMVSMIAPARRVSAAEAYRQLRESSELIDVTPVAKVDKVPSEPKARKRA